MLSPIICWAQWLWHKTQLSERAHSTDYWCWAADLSANSDLSAACGSRWSATVEKPEPCDKRHQPSMQSSKNDTSGRLSEYVMKFQLWQQPSTTLKKKEKEIENTALAVGSEICCQQYSGLQEKGHETNREAMSNTAQKTWVLCPCVVPAKLSNEQWTHMGGRPWEA